MADSREIPFSTQPASLQAALKRALPWLFGAIVILLFIVGGLRYMDETQRELRLLPWLPYDARVDFGYFFAGAEMAAKGDAADLYPPPGERTFYPGEPIFQQLTD